ncbi:MAG: polyamine aminopropyltransferase [Pseudomonadota bacterium]
MTSGPADASGPGSSDTPAEGHAEEHAEERMLRPVLLAATFTIAAAGLGYELVAGAASSYLLGDSITQFSLVIGLFMTAMGIGAWASRHVTRLENGFASAQVVLALAGGFSAPALFWAFAHTEAYEAVLLLVCLVAGALVGLEIPLVTRILQRRGALARNLSDVLALDYIGALVAALAFPLVLAPELGLIGAGLLMGLLNIAVAWVAIVMFGARVDGWVKVMALGVTAALGIGFAQTQSMTAAIESKLHADEVVLTTETPYQRLTLTRSGERWRLFLNGGLQFDTSDEHRYHEALVHPVMLTAPRVGEVLILGGGDGMAVREVLRHEGVERITLVDLDPEMTRLFRDHDVLSTLNGGALNDPRVEVISADAWNFLREDGPLYDVIIADLPDPRTLALSKLYSREFYTDMARRLSATGLFVTQATSPLFAREAYWTIEATLAATADPVVPGRTLATLTYHAQVPSFGPWGFVMAGGRIAPEPSRVLPEGLRFLTPAVLSGLSDFPADMARLPAEPNSITDHPLQRLYREGWDAWYD